MRASAPPTPTHPREIAFTERRVWPEPERYAHCESPARPAATHPRSSLSRARGSTPDASRGGNTGRSLRGPPTELAIRTRRSLAPLKSMYQCAQARCAARTARGAVVVVGGAVGHLEHGDAAREVRDRVGLSDDQDLTGLNLKDAGH